MKISREFKIGVVFIATLALFIWSYNYMKGKDIFNSSLPEFHVLLPQVQGLTTSSKVTMKGVVVGRVEKMTLLQKQDKITVDVLFTLDDPNLHIPSNSLVKLVSNGIMGDKSLAVIPGDGEYAKAGDTLRGKVENDIFATVEEQFNPIQKEVTKTLISTDSLVNGLNDILDAGTRKNLKSSIAKLNRSLTDFEKMTASLNKRIEENEQNIDDIFSGAKASVNNINALITRINTELEHADLTATIGSLQKTLSRIDALMAGWEQGKGSMGKLLNDKALYDNLTRASKELEELLRDMKEHPKRYVHFSVFGKKDKGYKQGDSLTK